ncbi:MAG: cupin domain-containing protein [Pseudoflavonifractor sp.]|nr:cupin domain-containing protein [Pseudoflavonifractor sp.]
MELKSQIDYQSGRVVSYEVIKNDNGRVSLLAFDEGTEISTHKAPGDVLVQVIEGSIDFVVEGVKRHLQTGGYLTMSVGTAHSVYAPERTKISLTIISPNCGQKPAADKIEGLLPD